MGIKDSFKKVMAKGVAKVAQTKVGKKVMEKQMDKYLKDMPDGHQKEAAKKAMGTLQNMDVDKQQEIAEKMKRLMGGKENPTQAEMMKRIRTMSPQERKEYEELAMEIRSMMGM